MTPETQTPTKLDHLEKEFYKHSNKLKEGDQVDRFLAFLACDAILLDTIEDPNWKRSDGTAQIV